jgi:hypothetical protein
MRTEHFKSDKEYELDMENLIEGYVVVIFHFLDAQLLKQLVPPHIQVHVWNHNRSI